MVSALYYLSIFSGPVYAVASSSFITLVPIHNVMQEPSYWYEDQFLRMCTGLPMIFQNIYGAEYWNDFTWEDKRMSYIVFTGISFGFYIGSTVIFYFIWTGMGYFPPLPISSHLAGSSLILAMNAAMWFR